MSRAGIEVLSDRLPEPRARLRARSEAAVQRAAAAIEERARALAPVDTGALRDSIHVERLDPTAYAVEAGTDHAAAVEYGTVRTPAQPFLTPAAEEARAGFVEEMRRVLDE